MTTEELHEILDDENRKLTLPELKEIIYKLKLDTLNEANKAWNSHAVEDSQAKKLKDLCDYKYYAGESNALQICLDLLEHLDIGEGS